MKVSQYHTCTFLMKSCCRYFPFCHTKTWHLVLEFAVSSIVYPWMKPCVSFCYKSFINLASVVQKLDRAIHWIISIQWISIRETNCTIQWVEIYMVDRAIQLLNNWGQKDPCVISNKIFDSGFLDSVCLTSTVVVNTSLHQLNVLLDLYHHG